MADNLKHDASTGHLVYNPTTGHLVYECGGCCDFTVTVSNCTDLNGSYDVTYGVDYDDGTIEILWTDPNVMIIQESGGGGTSTTVLGDRSGGDCPDQQSYAYEDGDCPGISVSVACT